MNGYKLIDKVLVLMEKTDKVLDVRVVDSEGHVREIEDFRLRQENEQQWVQIDIADPDREATRLP